MSGRRGRDDQTPKKPIKNTRLWCLDVAAATSRTKKTIKNTRLWCLDVAAATSRTQKNIQKHNAVRPEPQQTLKNTTLCIQNQKNIKKKHKALMSGRRGRDDQN